MVNIASWMANVNRTSAIHGLPTEFKLFLSAPVFEDSNGMLVSVLSALARMNMDPWQEADELSHMPVGNATQRLTSIIAGLPNRPSTSGNADTIARRLITLLPRSSGTKVSSNSAVIDVAEDTNSKVAIVYVVVMILTMSVQLVMTSRQGPSSVEHSTAQGSSGGPVPQQEQPTKSGR